MRRARAPRRVLTPPARRESPAQSLRWTSPPARGSVEPLDFAWWALTPIQTWVEASPRRSTFSCSALRRPSGAVASRRSCEVLALEGLCCALDAAGGEGHDGGESERSRERAEVHGGTLERFESTAVRAGPAVCAASDCSESGEVSPGKARVVRWPVQRENGASSWNGAEQLGKHGARQELIFGPGEASHPKQATPQTFWRGPCEAR